MAREILFDEFMLKRHANGHVWSKHAENWMGFELVWHVSAWPKFHEIEVDIVDFQLHQANFLGILNKSAKVE